MATSENSMANEHLSVTIESNGTLTLTDRWSSETYTRLLTFEECADIGDGWYHGPAMNDQVFVSTASHADVALVHNGPYLTTFRVRTIMNVPESFRFDKMVRASEMTPLIIDSYISLRPDQHYLDIHTVVENSADDHRLRVLFPSGARAAETYVADSAFDVVERPIALRADNYLYRELEVETKPQQSWTAVYDGGRGLAVVASGLLETAVRDLPERPLALTLFRGTRRTVFTEGEPGGQMRGRLEFDYRLVPLAARPDRARLCCLGQQLAAGLRAVQLRPADLPIFRSGSPLPPTAGFLRLEGPAVMSSARRVEGSLEVRLFNPDVEPVEARLNVEEWPGADAPIVARPVDFESRPTGEAEPVDGDLSITLGPKKIVTMSLHGASA
jgi:alpha-mannosidase/mannosylglycerate hydrolase